MYPASSIVSSPKVRLVSLALLLVGSFPSPSLADPDIVVDEASQLVIDQGGDGEVHRGDTVEFSLTVKNVGTNRALAVEVDNTLEPYLNVDSTSIEISPLGVDDSYEASENTQLSVSAPGLISNDRALYPQGGTPPGLSVDTTASDTATAQGGQVSINADGSFSYNPPADFTGTDQFSYTLTNDHGLTDTATVSLNVTEAVLYVSNTSNTGIPVCDNSPYSDIASAINALSNEYAIVVCAGDPYQPSATLMLPEGMQLLGEREWFGAGDRPVLQHWDYDNPLFSAADSLIDLGHNTEVAGLEFRASGAWTVEVGHSEDVIIRDNRFVPDPRTTVSLDTMIVFPFRTTPPDPNLSGWIVVARNEFAMNGAEMGRPAIAMEFQESAAYELRIVDNTLSNGYGEGLLRLEGDDSSSQIMELEGNTVSGHTWDPSAGGKDIVAFDLIDTDQGSSLDVTLRNNAVSVTADGNNDSNDFLDAVVFRIYEGHEACANLDGNSIQVNDTNMVAGNVSEYAFLRREDSTPASIIALQGVADSSYTSVKNHVQASDSGGGSVRVVTLLDGTDLNQDGTVTPASQPCATIQSAPSP